MRAPALLAALAVASAAGLFAFLRAPGAPPPQDASPEQPATGPRPETPPASDPPPADTTPDPLPSIDTPDPDPDAARSEQPADSTEPTGGPTRPFRGIVMTQPEGQRPVQALSGTLHLELLQGGSRTPLDIELPGGRFDAEVPLRARLVLLGGEVDGTRVRFEAPRGPFDPVPQDYALVALPIPEIRLVVREGGQGVPLSSVTVTLADEPTSCWLGDQTAAPTRTPLAKDTPSPVLLPHLDAGHPTWLRVSAEDYAATHVRVDPRKPQTKEVRLFPWAELDLRIAGPKADQVRMIVLGRIESETSKPHVATLERRHPAVEKGPSGVTFPIRGLAALPHEVVAKGYDGKGRTFDLGSTRVVLEPGVRKSLELRLD